LIQRIASPILFDPRAFTARLCETPAQWPNPHESEIRMSLRANSIRNINRLRCGARMAFGVAFCLLFLAASPSLAQSWSPSKSVQIDQIVAHFRELNGTDEATLPSMSVSIGVDGRLVAAKGYGASDGKPVDGHTLYEIGSITKQFTAAVALEMIKSGAVSTRSGKKLDLTTSLVSVFDDSSFWKAQPWLTVGRLLTMQSNLPNFTRRPPVGTDPWQPISADTLFKDIENQPPTTVSDDFDYSNTNYFLIAELMERSRLPGDAQPETYHELLRKRIFEPAGMVETRFIDDSETNFEADAAAPAAPVSTALSEQAAIWARPDYGRRRRPAFTNPDWLKGSADAVSSAVDLFAWDRALMDPKIVPVDIRNTMLAGQARVSPMIYYGMGWFYEEKDDAAVYSHSGAVPGYTSFNEIVRRKDGHWFSITILSNSDQLDGLDDLASSIAYIVTM
jgi:D-alanyl-D-alanine carboxypeptidase